MNAPCSPTGEAVALSRAPAGEPGRFLYSIHRAHASPRIRVIITAGFALLLATLSRAETLKIVTYNVENYVAANRMTEAGYREDYPKPEIQKTGLRSVLKRLDADVLVLQEMGGPNYLDELRRDLNHAGLEYPHTILLVGPDADRHVAVLSRRAFTSVRQHVDLTFPYFGGKEKVKRGMLEVTLETNGGALTLFGVHLKSRYTDRADDVQSAARRQGEATVIRDLVLTRFPKPAQGNFLILGDFNDDVSSKTLQRFRGRGSVRIAQLLPIADARGERWTHVYKKADSYTRVDHILVSAALFPAVRNGVGSIDDGVGVLETSDHRPVMVVLDFPDKK